MDLATVLEKVTNLAQTKKDVVVKLADIYPTILDDGSDVGLRLGNKASPKSLTQVGRESYLSKLGIPNALYNKCSAGLKLDLVREFHTNHVKSASDKPMFVRLINDKIRFMGSGDYGRIDDLDIVKVLSGIKTSLEIKDFEQEDTHFLLRALTKDPIEVKGLRPYFPGVQIVNSEVGRSSFKIQLILVEQVCTNGMVSSRFAKSYARVHRHAPGLETLLANATGLISKVDEFTEWSRNRLSALTSISGAEFLMRIRREHEIPAQVKEKTDELLPKYSSREGLDHTVLNVLSAFTEAIQIRPRLERVKLEAFAGDMIAL